MLSRRSLAAPAAPVALASLAALAAVGFAVAAEEKLPPPAFKARLICFNGKDGSGSNCSTTMAKIEGGLQVVTATLTCGFPGAVSEIAWTYRGHKDGKDVYHVVRRFPADSVNATTTDTEHCFGGGRHVLFEDESQCIVIATHSAVE